MGSAEGREVVSPWRCPKCGTASSWPNRHLRSAHGLGYFWKSWRERNRAPRRRRIVMEEVAASDERDEQPGRLLVALACAVVLLLLVVLL